MRRALVIRIFVYSLISVVAITLLSGGYLWYSMHRAMDAMYEPIPSVKWVDPVFGTDPGSPPFESPKQVTTSMTKEAEAEQQAAVKTSGETSFHTGPVSETRAEQLRHPDLSEEDPFSILLLGVDERVGDRGRSDTMILLTVQPKKGTVVALSIPRDTRVLMPNSGKYDKINHAYAFGGTSLAVETVERLFGVPIAYYMKTNMEGLVQIVDSLGGVDVDNERAFIYEGTSFPLGHQLLDGKSALEYSRMRKEDPQGDIGRTQRQRQIVSGAVDKVSSVNSITKLPRLLSQLSKYVRTNLNSQNMIDLVLNYRPAINHVESLNLQGKGTMVNGIYYYSVTQEERQIIQTKMLKYLNAD